MNVPLHCIQWTNALITGTEPMAALAMPPGSLSRHLPGHIFSIILSSTEAARHRISIMPFLLVSCRWCIAPEPKCLSDECSTSEDGANVCLDHMNGTYSCHCNGIGWSISPSRLSCIAPGDSIDFKTSHNSIYSLESCPWLNVYVSRSNLFGGWMFELQKCK